MKAYFIIIGLLLSLLVQGQTTPPISFGYDADGNMTARYVATTPASSPVRSAVNDKNDMEKKAVEPEEDIFSVTAGEQTINIYPNPTPGNIVLGVTGLDAKAKNFLRLYNVTGKLLLTVQIQSELTHLEIKGPAGMYLLDIHLGENVSKWKIIKE